MMNYPLLAPRILERVSTFKVSNFEYPQFPFIKWWFELTTILVRKIRTLYKT